MRWINRYVRILLISMRLSSHPMSYKFVPWRSLSLRRLAKYDYRCNVIYSDSTFIDWFLHGRYQALFKMYQPFYTPWYSILFVQLYVLYATIFVHCLIIAIIISMTGYIFRSIYSWTHLSLCVSSFFFLFFASFVVHVRSSFLFPFFFPLFLQSTTHTYLLTNFIDNITSYFYFHFTVFS